jgi:hypothetical protein
LQLRLGIEQFELARTTRHEQENDVLHFRGEVRRTYGSGSPSKLSSAFLPIPFREQRASHSPRPMRRPGGSDGG